MTAPLRTVSVTAAITLFLPALALAAGPHFTGWSQAQPAPDTDNSVAGGCPYEYREHTLFMASNRDGGEGDLDIWVAHRSNGDEAFGPAQNLGPPVNSEYADFCPTPLNGRYLLFVSTRPAAGSCGSGDMYLTRNNPAHGWEEPVNLGCAETGDGPNTAGGEFSPSLVETDEGVFLYFSSNGEGDMDIYVSEMYPDGSFSVGVTVDELNTEFDDRMPNVRKDGREIVFSSNRPTWGGGQPAIGAQDVYSAERPTTDSAWSDPANLGPNVNTGGSETRSTFSWDARRLYFGRAGEIYVSEREKLRGPK